MGKISDAKRKANNAWDAKNMKVVGCKLKVEDAELFAEYAKEQGTTVNALLQQFVFSCIRKGGGGSDISAPSADSNL